MLGLVATNYLFKCQASCKLLSINSVTHSCSFIQLFILCKSFSINEPGFHLHMNPDIVFDLESPPQAIAQLLISTKSTKLSKAASNAILCLSKVISRLKPHYLNSPICNFLRSLRLRGFCISDVLRYFIWILVSLETRTDLPPI
jgi:hypothetical protein